MEKNQVTTILFICPHHAAKSIMAAAYCNQIAAERGLALRADSAGTEPSAEVMPSVVALLASEGIDTAEFRPRQVTVDELSAAGWIVTFNCEAERLTTDRTDVIEWNDVPAASTDVHASSRAIRERVEALIATVFR